MNELMIFTEEIPNGCMRYIVETRHATSLPGIRTNYN